MHFAIAFLPVAAVSSRPHIALQCVEKNCSELQGQLCSEKKEEKKALSLLLLSCSLYSQSLSLHQSCSFHFPCCRLQCSGVQERNSSICCLQPPLLQPLRCNPKKYILFTYTNNYSPQLGGSNFRFPASNRFFPGQ